jgi:hypothetical protein
MKPLRYASVPRAAAVSVAILMGANGMAQAARSEDVTWDLAPSVRFQSHENSPYGEYARPTLILARSETEWDDAMALLDRDGGLIISPPRQGKDLGIDWKRYSVVLLAAGETSSGDLQVQVQTVRCHANDLLLDVNLDDPDPRAVRISSVYQIVLVPHRQWSLARTQCHGSGPACIPKVSMPMGSGNGVTSTASARPGVVESNAVSWGFVKGKYR